MKILNYGSLNIDYVYKVDHFVKAGETINSYGMEVFCGGKGLNQSIALAYAGAEVYHAGKIGSDSDILVNKLKESGVNTTFTTIDEGSSGHAIIQVNNEGNNCIILHGGANRKIQTEEIISVLSHFKNGDVLLLQNEINNLEYIIKKAKDNGMTIAFNPAPMEELVKKLPLNLVDYLIINEVEGEQLTGEKEPDKILDLLLKEYNDISVVLTLGEEGVKYKSSKQNLTLKPSKKINAVDTTAAGDTFIGYFLSAVTKGANIADALMLARNASEICITRKGASNSIPKIHEVLLY